jgi:hypothetical protein
MRLPASRVGSVSCRSANGQVGRGLAGAIRSTSLVAADHPWGESLHFDAIGCPRALTQLVVLVNRSTEGWIVSGISEFRHFWHGSCLSVRWWKIVVNHSPRTHGGEKGVRNLFLLAAVSRTKGSCRVKRVPDTFFVHFLFLSPSFSRLKGSPMVMPAARSSGLAPVTRPPAADSAARSGSLPGRLATLAGAAGAVAVGAGEAQAVTYTPTPGVVSAQGIPGFSFISDTNVTLGSLRPPASPGDTAWDVDGNGTKDFDVRNALLVGLFGQNGGQNLVASNGGSETNYIQNLSVGQVVSAARTFWTGRSGILTFNGNNSNPFFTTNVSGQFGLRFSAGPDRYYGWGSLVIDETPVDQGFKITEAYYNSTPGAAITVGQVPVAVPEPSSMALLAIGSAGVFAWRARRKVKADAGAAKA